jgi:hypothetical protein
MTDELIVHSSPWPEWFATQDVERGVSICDKGSDRRIVIEPPLDWGSHWAWNLTEDGTGVYFRTTQ